MHKKVLWSDKPKSRIVWPKFKILFVLENWHSSLSIKHSSPTVKQQIGDALGVFICVWTRRLSYKGNNVQCQILKENLLKSARKFHLGYNFIFQENYNPKQNYPKIILISKNQSSRLAKGQILASLKICGKLSNWCCMDDFCNWISFLSEFL